MGWTKEQQKAIDKREKNLLVAAAAGSGKTAVLVERIKKLVLEENVPIDRMLVVTFTNAAAAEMKEKLRKALIKEISDGTGDKEKLREQMKLMRVASISTFHAFALDVMRRFFYLLELEPGFSICDEALTVVLKEEAMDELLEKYFNEGSPEFYEFLNCYSGERNMGKVRNIIDSSYKVIQSLPYPWQWLDEKTKELSLSREEFVKSDVYQFMWKYIRNQTEAAYDAIKKVGDILDENGYDYLFQSLSRNEFVVFEELLEAMKNENFDGFGNILSGFKYSVFRTNKEDKESYEEIKPVIENYRNISKKITGKLKEEIFTDTLEEQIKEINMSAAEGETLKKMLKDYDMIFSKKKQERKLIDFSDIEHYCLEILSNEQAAEFYRKKFRYVFVDEYQDTNVLQEEILSKVKRKDNIFMVGDIKQSIYKFRLAEPEIFRNKYEKYRNCTDSLSEKIDLNRNFRSKPAIINGINQIFEEIMEGYDHDAKLYAGFPYAGPYNYDPEVHVLDGLTIDKADPEVAELKKTEIEALDVCRIIKDNIGKIIFDQKLQKERPLELKDMVILMRGVKNYADIYYNIMKEQGIEAFIDDSESYFDTIEIDIFMKLLAVIDNRMQDVPLISVLHSGIFGFSADELALVRKDEAKGSYAEVFINYSENGEDEDLKEKCNRALQQLKEWKELSQSVPLGRFIWSVMLDSGYYLEMGAMPGGVQRQMNLRALVDKAENYAAQRPGSLYNFIKYIDTLKNKKVKVGQVKLVGESDNLVRIMTIHKSKGLEFPMVIVSGAGRKLNYTKMSEGIVLHKSVGIGMQYVNYNEHWKKKNLLYRLISKQVHVEEFEEEVRILYVALTRAKDILYITGFVRDGDKYAEKAEAENVNDETYLSIMGNSYPVKYIDISGLSLNTQQEGGKFRIDSPSNYISEPAEKEIKKVKEKLNYRYDYEDKRQIKSKYSVSELNKEVVPGADDGALKELSLSVPSWKQGEHRITGAERGTVYHKLLETCDFVKADEEGAAYIERKAAELVEKGILTKEELQSVSLSYVIKFFETDIGKRCIKAAKEGKLNKERSFNLMTMHNGDQVIVQGIIDCFFEENGEIVLLDYKTNWVNTGRMEEETERLRRTYRKQMEIYSEALEVSTGMKVKEKYLVHLETETAIDM